MRKKKEKAEMHEVSLYPSQWEALKAHALKTGVTRSDGKPNVSGMLQAIIDDLFKIN